VLTDETKVMLKKITYKNSKTIGNFCRWGTTPIDESRKCGSKSLMFLLENAKADELSKFPSRAEDIQGKLSNIPSNFNE
jgi:potassium channel